jgi:hypothetical protein
MPNKYSRLVQLVRELFIFPVMNVEHTRAEAENNSITTRQKALVRLLVSPSGNKTREGGLNCLSINYDSRWRAPRARCLRFQSAACVGNG